MAAAVHPPGMGTEIERKFLVASDAWRTQADGGTAIRQFYLAVHDGLSVRVRIREGRRAVLTIKTAKPEGALSRGEYEYEIPAADALQLEAARLGETLEKRRHLVPLGELTIEVDVFAGAHAPLVLAEIEIPDENHALVLPDWIGEDVSRDPRFSNASLAVNGLPAR